MKFNRQILILVSVFFTAGLAQAGTKVPYPDGFRYLTHIKTMVLYKGHTLANPFMGIHQVYGNKKAVKGVKTGNFADGSVLVFDLHSFQTKNKASTEGKRILVGVMQKDSQRYRKTGGWGFEGFKGNSHNARLVNDNGKSCFDCHLSQKNHGYVFSHWQD